MVETEMILLDGISTQDVGALGTKPANITSRAIFTQKYRRVVTIFQWLLVVTWSRESVFLHYLDFDGSLNYFQLRRLFNLRTKRNSGGLTLAYLSSILRWLLKLITTQHMQSKVPSSTKTELQEVCDKPNY